MGNVNVADWNQGINSAEINANVECLRVNELIFLSKLEEELVGYFRRMSEYQRCRATKMFANFARANEKRIVKGLDPA